jgi:hypothetical protein
MLSLHFLLSQAIIFFVKKQPLKRFYVEKNENHCRIRKVMKK